MANDDAASKRSVEERKPWSPPRLVPVLDMAVIYYPGSGAGLSPADEIPSHLLPVLFEEVSDAIARAHANARYTVNLQRAFGDLVLKLKRVYGQPAGDAAVTRSQDADALWAIAGFLDQMGPVGDLARFADQFAKLAQKLDDLDKGTRAPSLEPAPVTSRRPDPTIIWVARAHVVVAVKTIQRCGHIRGRDVRARGSAAKWVAEHHPELKKLITESAGHRSHDLKKAIISWCLDFNSHKIRNKRAADVHSVGLDKLKAPNCTIDQIEGEADRLLRRAVALLT